VENFQTYTSGFGYRSSPMDGSQQFHAGLDMAGPWAVIFAIGGLAESSNYPIIQAVAP
jgi:murein DD-endopeptidase MepM/ murein hydrolase activator NlpD